MSRPKAPHVRYLHVGQGKRGRPRHLDGRQRLQVGRGLAIAVACEEPGEICGGVRKSEVRDHCTGSPVHACERDQPGDVRSQAGGAALLLGAGEVQQPAGRAVVVELPRLQQQLARILDHETLRARSEECSTCGSGGLATVRVAFDGAMLAIRWVVVVQQWNSMTSTSSWL